MTFKFGDLVINPTGDIGIVVEVATLLFVKFPTGGRWYDADELRLYVISA